MHLIATDELKRITNVFCKQTKGLYTYNALSNYPILTFHMFHFQYLGNKYIPQSNLDFYILITDIKV